MGRYKIFLDLLVGAVIPLLILNYGTSHIGARPAFILAGVIPAVYVICDVAFFTKRFNAITTIIGITAITQGGLSFLKVDGWRYALQDTAGTIVMFVLYGATLLVGKPMVQYFVVQVLEPQDPEEEALAAEMLRDRRVHKALLLGTAIIVAENLLRGIANYILNLRRVTAEFGTDTFNMQKAGVDSLTRFIYPLVSIAAMIAAIMLAMTAIEKWIGEAGDEGGTMFDQIRRKLGRPPKPPKAADTDAAKVVTAAAPKPAIAPVEQSVSSGS